MASIKIYHDTQREKSNGTFPIKISDTNWRNFYISVGLSVSKNDFNGIEITKGCENYKRKNNLLRAIYNNVEDVIFEINKQPSRVSDDLLKSKIKESIGKRKKESFSFIDYLDRFVATKSNNGTIAVLKKN